MSNVNLEQIGILNWQQIWQSKWWYQSALAVYWDCILYTCMCSGKGFMFVQEFHFDTTSSKIDELMLLPIQE